MNDLLNPGSIWIGPPPKDGAILTPHGNTLEKEEPTKDRFQWDEATQTLKQINNGKNKSNKTKGERPAQD